MRFASCRSSRGPSRAAGSSRGPVLSSRCTLPLLLFRKMSSLSLPLASVRTRKEKQALHATLLHANDPVTSESTTCCTALSPQIEQPTARVAQSALWVVSAGLEGWRLLLNASDCCELAPIIAAVAFSIATLSWGGQCSLYS